MGKIRRFWTSKPRNETNYKGEKFENINENNMIVIDSKESLLKSDDEEDLIFDHSTLLHKDFGKDVANREPGYRCCPSGGKLQIAKTINLCLSFFGLGLCFAIPTATLTDLQTAVQANENIKNIYTARYSGYLFGAIIGGFLFDCYNRQFLLFLSLLATGIGIIIMPFCQELPALMACTAVTGITMGFLDTGGNVWCLDLWGRRSAPFMQALHFCFGLGAFVAPLVAEPFLSPLSGHFNGSLLENNTFLNGSLLSVPRVGLPQYPLISGKHIIVKHSFGDIEDSFPLLNEYELDRTKREASFYNESDWANNTATEIFINPYNSTTETLNKTANSENENPMKKISSVTTTLITTSTTVKPKPKFADGNQLPKDLKWVKPPMDKDGNPITSSGDQSSQPSSTVASASTSTNSSSTLSPNTSIPEIGSLNSTFNESKENTEDSKTTELATTSDIPRHLTEVTSTKTTATTVGAENSFNSTLKSLANSDTNQGDNSSQITEKKVYYPETKLNDSEHPQDFVNSPKASVTSTPASATSTLASVTSTPASATSTPASVTSTPASVTSTPASVTSTPASVTSTPASATSTPASATSTPASDTSIPASATSIPASATSIPASATSIPASDTSTPASDTSTPASDTSTPASTTSIPASATSTPASDTSIPTKADKIKVISSPPPQRNSDWIEEVKLSSSTNSPSLGETSTKVKPLLKQAERLPLMLKQSSKLLELSSNPVKETTVEQTSPISIISSLKINTSDPQKEINESEINQNKSEIWDNDIFSTVFDFLHKNRLGKFEIPYILLAVYIFFVAFVFLVFLCKNPREPRSMQLEDTNKSRDVSLSFRVVMVGLMALFLCLYVGIEVGVGELLETFATTENLPQTRGYFLPYLFWGSFAVSRGYSIFVATRVSGRVMLIANLSVCLVASIMLVAGADKLEALLWIGVVLLGLSYGPLFPTSIAWLENYLHITNKTASIFILGAAVGEIVIPIIIDLFINQEPMVLMYVNVIVSALCFISFIVLCVMASKHKKYGGKKPNRSMYELANTHDYDDSSELLSSANNDRVNKSTTNGYYLQIKNRSVSGNGSEYSRILEA